MLISYCFIQQLLPFPQETIRRYKDDKFPATRQSLIGQSGIIELLQNAEKDVFSIEWRRPWVMTCFMIHVSQIYISDMPHYETIWPRHNANKNE